MKLNLLFIMLLATALSSNAQTAKKYIITSDIKNLSDTSYNLTIWNGTSQTENKKGSVKDGQIYYTDTTSVPLVIRLTLPTDALFKRAEGGFYPVKSQSIWLVASPGSTISLKGHLSDFAEVYPWGDQENDVIRALNTVYHPLINKAINITMQLSAKDNQLSEAQRSKLKNEQAALNEQSNEFMVSFLKKNANSIAGLYYINDMLLRKVVSLDMAEELLPTIKNTYRTTSYFKTLEQRVAGSKFDVGRPILEIASSNTLDSKKFSTDVWKGKFYLIDFWGSWCGPCIADFPDLKKLKMQFPNQLEVLGIAQDKDEAWKKAIEAHGLNWTHILNGTQNDDFVSRLNVIGFPTKILVDPNGTIVYRSSGGGSSSFEKIAEIIKGEK